MLVKLLLRKQRYGGDSPEHLYPAPFVGPQPYVLLQDGLAAYGSSDDDHLLLASICVYNNGALVKPDDMSPFRCIDLVAKVPRAPLVFSSRFLKYSLYNLVVSGLSEIQAFAGRIVFYLARRFIGILGAVSRKSSVSLEPQLRQSPIAIRDCPPNVGAGQWAR